MVSITEHCTWNSNHRDFVCHFSLQELYMPIMYTRRSEEKEFRIKTILSGCAAYKNYNNLKSFLKSCIIF